MTMEAEKRDPGNEVASYAPKPELSETSDDEYLYDLLKVLVEY